MPQAAAARLEQLVHDLRVGDVPAGDRAWLADGLAAVLEGVPIERAFGLGGRWLQRRRQARRDELIAELLQDAASPSVRAGAAALHQDALRYASSTYRVDRRRGGPEAEDRRPLFELLEAEGGKVPGRSTIRRIASAAGESVKGQSRG